MQRKFRIFLKMGLDWILFCPLLSFWQFLCWGWLDPVESRPLREKTARHGVLHEICLLTVCVRIFLRNISLLLTFDL